MVWLATVLLLLFEPSAACDAGVLWGEKSPGNFSASAWSPDAHLDMTSWPKAMRERVHRRGGLVNVGDGWPAGANATSYSHTLTWEKMDPPMGGNVFVSLTVAEGCGAGYIGAQLHGGTNKMFTDWAIWDSGANNTVPLAPNCVRYDGEGHGTQCGVPDGHTWEFDTPYIFNVTIVDFNTSGTHFKATVKNGFTEEVIPMGEIWTARNSEDQDCNRLIVGGGGFQEIYSGGNFTNIATVEGPIFRGVKGHPGDVMPTGFGDCYMHSSCYGKDGGTNCRNETMHHCLRPDCPIPKETFFSGQVDIPNDMIPPWDHHPDVEPSTECWFAESTGLEGGTQPEYWGMPLIDGVPADVAKEKCCGYCLADSQCVGAQLYGDRCSLRHATNSSPPFKYPKNQYATSAILPMRSYPAPPKHALSSSVYV